VIFGTHNSIGKVAHFPAGLSRAFYSSELGRKVIWESAGKSGKSGSGPGCHAHRDTEHMARRVGLDAVLGGDTQSVCSVWEPANDLMNYYSSRFPADIDMTGQTLGKADLYSGQG
jgi:hypothetical protein